MYVNRLTVQQLPGVGSWARPIDSPMGRGAPVLLSVGPSGGKQSRGGQAKHVVLTSPQTTLPPGGALSSGLIAVARQPPGVKALLFWALIAAVGFFVDESSTSDTLHCAWGNNRGSQGAMWSLRFQISFLHLPDHKPGSSAPEGDAAWPQGAGRREGDARPCA